MVAHPRHVAILDDDPSVRTALGRLLKAEGMTVAVHATSDELYKSIAQKCPDCLLLDLQMPETSGLDVLKYLDQRHIHIPTIMITGHDEPISRSACLNAGAMAYLIKPAHAGLLIQTINRVSQASHAGALASFG